MSWWISLGDDTTIAQGSPERIAWPTLDEALVFVRNELARGRRVVELRGPSGRVWNETAVRRLLERL
jgi:hypothetical protein